MSINDSRRACNFHVEMDGHITGYCYIGDSEYIHTDRVLWGRSDSWWINKVYAGNGTVVNVTEAYNCNFLLPSHVQSVRIPNNFISNKILADPTIYARLLS